MHIARARAQFNINAHIEIDTSAFRVGCQLYSAAWAMSLGLCFNTIQWHETNVLDDWQLVVLPHSGGTESNPRWVHDNLSVLLRVYMGFPVPGHQN